MTVEGIRGNNENCFDNFPVGMRVLAVDDDPTCLKLLDTLLRNCQYHVTTTSQARMALKMLRENKDRFDLVISDVHMPDMDGFKLLELVGLEMDLPVIMLSANSDPKLVMKGVDHGACDYLVKPVRIEELRNIWQHVIRRKKFDSKNQHRSTDQARVNWANGGHRSPMAGNADQNLKYNRKRKDEEDDIEDNGNESEDPATQKKPRVVWSIELHRKFVAAVNQLGIEKAVPKQILDLMNVEALTRENVASHLQKYRLYLKRIARQQANMVAALGVKDSRFTHIGSLDKNGIEDFRGRLTNSALSPCTSGGMIFRLNSPGNINLRNLTPSALIQPNNTQNLSNPMTAFAKMHPVISPSSQGLFRGMPSSLDFDQLQLNNTTTGLGNFNSIDDPQMFATTNTFADPATGIGGSNNSSKNSMILHGTGGFGNHPSNNTASFNSEAFNAAVITASSNLLETGAMESSNMQANSFHGQLPKNSRKENDSSTSLYLQKNSIGLSSGMMVSATLNNSQGIWGPEGFTDDVQNTNQAPGRRWGGEQRLHNFGYSSSNLGFASLDSHVPADGGVSPLGQNLDMLTDGRSGVRASTIIPQQNGNEKLGVESGKRRSNENILLEQPKLQGGFPRGYDALDELVSAVIKWEHEGSIPNCDFGFNDYSFGTGL